MSIYGVKGCSRNCIALLYGMLHHTRHYFSYIMATGAPSIDHKCLTLYQIQTICKINIIKYLKIVFERIENIERNGENVVTSISYLLTAFQKAPFSESLYMYPHKGEMVGTIIFSFSNNVYILSNANPVMFRYI